MLNLTGCRTVGGKPMYDLDRLDVSRVTGVAENVREVLIRLLRNRQVLYDLGQAVVFVCDERIVVEYCENYAIRVMDENGVSVILERFVGCSDAELHEALRGVFSGEYGPTSTDIIIRLLNSGLEVELCGTEKCGPQDSKTFMEDLRAQTQTEFFGPASCDDCGNTYYPYIIEGRYDAKTDSVTVLAPADLKSSRTSIDGLYLARYQDNEGPARRLQGDEIQQLVGLTPRPTLQDQYLWNEAISDLIRKYASKAGFSHDCMDDKFHVFRTPTGGYHVIPSVFSRNYKLALKQAVKSAE